VIMRSADRAGARKKRLPVVQKHVLRLDVEKRVRSGEGGQAKAALACVPRATSRHTVAQRAQASAH